MSESIALDINCPICDRHPVDSSAKLRWVRGFLVWYTMSSRVLIGCSSCVRRELLLEGARSAVLGWFSVRAFFINLALVPYNLIRGATLRPNPAKATERLRDLGYDPDVARNLLQAGYSLAAAVVVADGTIDPSARSMAVRVGKEMFTGFDEAAFDGICRDRDHLPASHDVARLLGSLVSVPGRDVLFSYAVAIAQADGAVSPQEDAELQMIAAGLNLNIEGWAARLEPPAE